MIIGLCGVPRAGKTAFMTEKVLKDVKKGFLVYTNWPVPGALKLERDMLEKYAFPIGCKVYVDEAKLWFNSREWKHFSENLSKLFACHGHIQSDIYLGVQHPARIDKEIRELIEEFVWITKIGLFLDTKMQKILLFRHEHYQYADINNNEMIVVKTRFRTPKNWVYRNYDTHYMRKLFDGMEECPMYPWEIEYKKHKLVEKMGKMFHVKQNTHTG